MNWNTNFEIELHETGYIGVWYSMLAFQGKEIEKALFVSPILDMKKYIELMPQREDAYYKWVINHPITHWDASTSILRPEQLAFLKAWEENELSYEGNKRNLTLCHIEIPKRGLQEGERSACSVLDYPIYIAPHQPIVERKATGRRPKVGIPLLVN